MENYQKYLDPATLARLEGLRLRARHIVEGYVSGVHRSPFHGFSIEFAEHREYTPGDDLHYLDWKVFGRTDKYYLKQYEQETNLVCYLLLDTSQSMQYRSPRRTDVEAGVRAVPGGGVVVSDPPATGQRGPGYVRRRDPRPGPAPAATPRI